MRLTRRGRWVFGSLAALALFTFGLWSGQWAWFAY